MMQTLVFNGSPKAHGDTTALLDAFLADLQGDTRVLTWRDGISPCTDCRHCWQHPGCAIDDAMQAAYQYLETCDNVAIASPIWFSSLSGPLLTLASRLQAFYAAGRFRGEPPPLSRKHGVLLLAGAEPGTEKIPTATALTLFRLMNVRRPLAATAFALDTDNTPAHADRAALDAARQAARTLNRLYGEGKGS